MARTLNYEALKREFRSLNHGGGDAWGSVLGALFRVCDQLNLRASFDRQSDALARDVADFLCDAGYRPAAVSDFRDYMRRELADDYEAVIYSEGRTRDLIKFGRHLNKAADILKRQGRDY